VAVFLAFSPRPGNHRRVNPPRREGTARQRRPSGLHLSLKTTTRRGHPFWAGISRMPLTPFQREVARVIAANHNPESHIAGGAVINRGDSGLRISDDLDIFHDVAASVAASA